MMPLIEWVFNTAISPRKDELSGKGRAIKHEQVLDRQKDRGGVGST